MKKLLKILKAKKIFFPPKEKKNLIFRLVSKLYFQ